MAEREGDPGRISGRFCVAVAPNSRSCRNTCYTPGITMHEFPSDPEIRAQWVKFVQRYRVDFGEPVNKYASLCSAHFEPSCYPMTLRPSLEGMEQMKRNKVLIEGSVPTRHTVIPAMPEELTDRRERQLMRGALSEIDPVETKKKRRLHTETSSVVVEKPADSATITTIASSSATSAASTMTTTTGENGLDEEIGELIVVASTFMKKNFECVMAWSQKEKKLLRPVTNVKANSWRLGTFTVGLTYEFVIRDSTPQSPWPHKFEDIVVHEYSLSRGIQLHEPELYKILVDSSRTLVTDIFPPDAIKENQYIEEFTMCPSVGILRCEMSNIEIYINMFSKYRCKIFSDLEFPLAAQNRESLRTDLADCAPENCLLVLLGLARPFAGSGNNTYNPRRCYIMVIGIIRAD